VASSFPLRTVRPIRLGARAWEITRGFIGENCLPVAQEITTILPPNFDYCDRSATFSPLCSINGIFGLD
jgi:hypothetical protein